MLENIYKKAINLSYELGEVKLGIDASQEIMDEKKIWKGKKYKILNI